MALRGFFGGMFISLKHFGSVFERDKHSIEKIIQQLL